MRACARRLVPRFLVVGAAAAMTTGLVSIPTAAADCTVSNGVSVCAQGTVRGPDGGTGPGLSGPVVPYPCDYDYLCDAGLSIDIGPFDPPDRPNRPGGGGGGIRPGGGGRN